MKEKQKLNIHQLFWYFVLFSIVGLIVETLYGFATMRIWESRKGLVWGPFCPVYGVGAVILIVLLNSCKDNKGKLFFYGAIAGSAAEYLMSYCLEAVYGTRFWEYSYVNLHLNGRICITYTIFWGILAIFLMRLVKPWIDKGISNIPTKLRNPAEIMLLTFLVIDALATFWAVSAYEARTVSAYYQVEEKEAKNVGKEMKEKIEKTLFSNEFMLKTFPNLRFMDKEGNQHYIRDVWNNTIPKKGKE